MRILASVALARQESNFQGEKFTPWLFTENIYALFIIYLLIFFTHHFFFFFLMFLAI